MANLPNISLADIQSFTEYLKGCRRITALVGAGLSAPSGLPTFRGAGGLWRKYRGSSLATPSAFNENPGLVWQFYSHRRHLALEAEPNKAHYALAELARKNRDFITISQNVDGLSPRAQHPPRQLYLLHGSLFDVKCNEASCDYTRQNDFTDPIVPALAIPQKGLNLPASRENEVDISDVANSVPDLEIADLPQCPKCDGLLRPGVVWYEECLPSNIIDAVEEWFDEGYIDLMLVIGTSLSVSSASHYIDTARHAGARVAVINMDAEAGDVLKYGDWFFQGDAAVLVPELLKGIIGKI
ncbi:SIR2 family histone deacetylase [Penicillium odoratum]|uniref:SIR2 family histone deacetylase n=1 Tax=Penicillium odoratum TaxID=1167516 RepID=UPI002547C514|nr:SIR2 family histone deacetylase [Penicillium odoratum]KAJ5759481.1 SIR2 family histone deacetylase [Penicillium odoratum]